MATVVKPKPIKSTEINFESNEDFEEFVEFINNPPETSSFVKDLIKNYQKQSGNK